MLKIFKIRLPNKYNYIIITDTPVFGLAYWHKQGEFESTEHSTECPLILENREYPISR
jgi:hypothetical protein